MRLFVLIAVSLALVGPDVGNADEKAVSPEALKEIERLGGCLYSSQSKNHGKSILLRSTESGREGATLY